MIRRYAMLICGCWLALAALVGAQPAANDLLPYTQTILRLDDTTPAAEFRFRAEAGATWSFSAAPLVAGLDPVLRILGPQGDELAANDDQIDRSPTARIEGWRAPADGTYTLVVTRRGAGVGQVRLLALGDNHSLALAPLPIPPSVTLRPGEAYTLADNLDARRAPIRVRLGVDADFAAGDRLGVQMQSRAGNGVGSWLLVLGATGATLQRTTALETQSTAEPNAADLAPEVVSVYEAVLADVDTPLTPGAYEIILASRTLLLRIDGERALSLDAGDLPEWFNFFSSAGALRVVALPANTAALSLSAPYASAPYYGIAAQPADALPPAPAADQLQTDSLVPRARVEELRARGFVQSERPGELLFSQPDAVLQTSATGFSALPLGLGEGVADVVLSFTLRIRAEAHGAACGVAFRTVPSGDFSAAMLNTAGEAYLLTVAEDTLAPPALAQASPWLYTGADVPNQLLVIVEGEQATLFANNVRLGIAPVERRAGGVSLMMVLETATPARCRFDNIWAWSLD